MVKRFKMVHMSHGGFFLAASMLLKKVASAQLFIVYMDIILKSFGKLW